MTRCHLAGTLRSDKESDKERLRNHNRQEETKETGWLDAMWDPGLDSGTEKEHWWKNRCNPNKLCSLDNSIVPMLIFGFDHCPVIIQGVNLRGNWWGVNRKSGPFLQLLYKSKIISKLKVKKKKAPQNTGSYPKRF